jgi:hypothetical protein
METNLQYIFETKTRVFCLKIMVQKIIPNLTYNKKAPPKTYNTQKRSQISKYPEHQKVTLIGERLLPQS